MGGDHSLQLIPICRTPKGTCPLRSCEVRLDLGTESVGILFVTLPGERSLSVSRSFKSLLFFQKRLLESIPLQEQALVQLSNDLVDLFGKKESSEAPHVLGLDIQDRVTTIEMRDNIIEWRRQKESLFADVLRILQAEHRLPRHLNRENVDGSQFGIIHESFNEVGGQVSTFDKAANFTC